MNIRKQRIWPLILVSIIVTILIGLLGSEYVIGVALDSYHSDCQQIDQTARQLGTYLEQEFNNKQKALLSYRDLMNQLTNADSSLAKEDLLHICNQSQQFDQISFATKEELPYYALSLSFYSNHTDLIFVVPLGTTAPAATYLCGKISFERLLQEFQSFHQELFDSIYIIDNRNNVFLSLSKIPMHYNEIPAENFYNAVTSTPPGYHSLFNNAKTLLHL